MTERKDEQESFTCTQGAECTINKDGEIRCEASPSALKNTGVCIRKKLDGISSGHPSEDMSDLLCDGAKKYPKMYQQKDS